MLWVLVSGLAKGLGFRVTLGGGEVQRFWFCREIGNQMEKTMIEILQEFERNGVARCINLHVHEGGEGITLLTYIILAASTIENLEITKFAVSAVVI